MKKASEREKGKKKIYNKIINQIVENLPLLNEWHSTNILQKFDNIIRKDPENMIALQHASYLYSIEGERKKTETEKRTKNIFAY